MSLLLTTEYFGPISSYALSCKYGKVIIEASENYQKKSYRNRCFVNSPDGEIMLSVPLQSGKNAKTPITEVKISYAEDWTKTHLKALEMGYRHSPFYEYYIDDITEIIRRKPENLYELNADILSYFIKTLDLEIVTDRTTDYHKTYEDIEDLRLLNYRNKNRNISVKRYRQPFDDKFDFIDDLSILDLLFCVGPESVLYLQNAE